MNVPATNSHLEEDTLLLALARDIAIDHNDIEDILKLYQISNERWRRIQANPRFNKLLEAELAAWHSAMNTEERTKLKAAAMVEHWLPEAHRLLHAPGEALAAKTKLAELIAKIGGHGVRAQGAELSGADKFSVVINLGADSNLTFEKSALPHKVIEGDPQ